MIRITIIIIIRTRKERFSLTNKCFVYATFSLFLSFFIPVNSCIHLNGKKIKKNISVRKTASFWTLQKETKAGTLNFSSFKSSFTSNVNFLKRRFSSGDLSSEADDVDPNTLPPAARPIQDQPTKPASVASSGGPPNVPPPPAPNTTQSTTQEFSLNLGSGGKAAASTTATSAVPPRGVSAPTSPAKSRESLLQRVQSLTGAARDQGASILGAAVQSATRAPAFNKDKYITLLVLDDHNTDWSKYFRGKRLHGDYDIRVEQAEFRDVTLHASADSGPVITMEVHRGDSRIPRMFRPDFVLIRQPPRDGANDYRSTILGLKYGGVPSINSLNSVYQFQDKPWVFAHLQQLQRRLGKDVFPLIEQTFFPSPKYLLNWTKFPCVLKAGHCHGGMATARFENQSALQDAAGLVTGTGSEGHCYCTIEPYIDAKFDIHIQKIGNNYKAFMRKSITGNWKTNQGSAMLEQITLTDKYKSWVDEVSEMFGGMEVCGLSLVVGRDGREHIIKASDSTFALMGDTQEDDRRQIADLVTSRMQNVCRPGAGQIQGKITARSSVSSLTGSPTDESGAPPPAPAGPRPAPMGGPPPIPERTSPAVGSIGRLTSRSSISEVPEETTATAVAPASVAPSTDSKAQSDLDIIFGSSTKYNRASSDAELIFGTPLSYKSERFGSSKSMSVASDNSYGYNPGSNATTGGGNAYKIYEGIQNAAFTDFADSPASQIKSKIDKKLSGITDDEDDLDLK